MRANEQTDERVAQYYSLYSWLFSTIVYLRHVSYGISEPGQVELFEIMMRVIDGAIRGVIKAIDELNSAAFPTSRLAYQSKSLAFFHRHREMVQSGALWR